MNAKFDPHKPHGLEGDTSMNRKLIRPNLSEIKDKMKIDAAKKRMHPPTDTFAENYYYLKQMNKKTRVAVVFIDGEVLEGFIEWYDRNCIKLNRDNAPNLLVFKSRIKYIYKLDEGKEVPESDNEKKDDGRP
jgi:host factor-I protein